MDVWIQMDIWIQGCPKALFGLDYVSRLLISVNLTSTANVSGGGVEDQDNDK